MFVPIVINQYGTLTAICSNCFRIIGELSLSEYLALQEEDATADPDNIHTTQLVCFDCDDKHNVAPDNAITVAQAMQFCQNATIEIILRRCK